MTREMASRSGWAARTSSYLSVLPRAPEGSVTSLDEARSPVSIWDPTLIPLGEDLLSCVTHARVALHLLGRLELAKLVIDVCWAQACGRHRAARRAFEGVRRAARTEPAPRAGEASSRSRGRMGIEGVPAGTSLFPVHARAHCGTASGLPLVWGGGCCREMTEPRRGGLERSGNRGDGCSGVGGAIDVATPSHRQDAGLCRP